VVTPRVLFTLLRSPTLALPVVAVREKSIWKLTFCLLSIRFKNFIRSLEETESGTSAVCSLGSEPKTNKVAGSAPAGFAP